MPLSWFRSLVSRQLKSLRSNRRGSRKPIRTRKLYLEYLEDRTLLNGATWYVNASAGAGGNGETQATAFQTIQQGINAADPNGGDTVEVAAGTYDEHVVISNSLTLLGANASINPNTTTRGLESIIDGTETGATLTINASGVTVNGFTIQGGQNGGNAGIAMSASTSGVDILDNIITNNTIGIYANSDGASLIQDNDFSANNLPGSSGGTSIYSENTNGMVIDSNVFTGQTVNNPVIFGATAASVHQNLQFTNNDLYDNSVAASGVYCVGISGGLFRGNSITTGGQASGIRLGGADTNITIVNNNLYDNDYGVNVIDDGYGLGSNSNVVVHLNSITDSVTDGISVDANYVGGPLDASGNWWGTAGPNPNDSTAATAINGMVSDGVTIGSFLNSGANTAAVGFTPSNTTQMWVPETSLTSTLSHVNGVIQSGINNAVSGMTVLVAADTYVEDLVVNKSVVLAGAGQGSTILLPAVANVGDSNNLGSEIGSSTNMILVQSDNVTIHDLTVDGSNPTLAGSSGSTTVGGINVDARNGIITDFRIGTYQNLTVYNTTVQNIYERGIYSTGENYGNTFDFHDNFVQNVQGNAGSIAIFNFGGSGTIEHNDVNEANDAISANWSQGTQFLDNTITNSGSGIHTDNNGGAGGGADLIQGNNVSLGTTGAYGIFVFVPYVNVSVEGNTISGVDVGLAAFGGSGGSATFTSNQVTGNAGSYGALVTDDQLGYDTGSVSATFTGNTLSGGTVGLYVEQILDNNTPSSTTTVTASGNSITGNSTAGVQMIGGSVMLAQNTIQSNGIGVQVNGGTLTSANENFISNNTSDGVQIGTQTSAGIFTESYAQNQTTTGAVGTIFNNDLSGNGGLGVNNTTGTLINASGNWWGSNTLSGVQSAVSSNVDFSPWLNSSTDTDLVTAGFQGDFSYLNVSAASPQAGSDSLIQEAINLATSGGTVNVLAGNYVANGNFVDSNAGVVYELNIDKPLTLLGPNATYNPLSSTTAANPQAIILPGASDPDPFDSTAVTIIGVNSSNVTIQGFTIDGYNPALYNDPHTIQYHGAYIDAAEGISSYQDVGNITISNNIIRNTAYTGIDFENGVNSGNATTNNTITQNYLFNLGGGGFGYGIGVVLYDNFYAAVTDNVANTVRVGVQTGNFYQANPGGAGTADISYNQLAVVRRGIFYNLAYENASPFTVTNNTITAVEDPTSSSKWDGILISSQQGTVSATFQNNTIDGSATASNNSQTTAGYEAWNTPTTGTLLVSGGTVSGVDYGVWVNTYEGYGPSDADNTQLTVSGLNITASQIGVYVEDSPQNTNQPTATAVIENNTQITTGGSGTGILVSGSTASATVTGNTITNNTNGIEVTDGGNLTSATSNTITNNSNDGLMVESTAGAIGMLRDNTFSANSGYGIDNQSANVVSAEDNFWGTTTGPTISSNPYGTGDKINGNVNYSPFATNSAFNSFALAVTPAATQTTEVNVSTSINLGSFLDTLSGDNPWGVDVNWGDGSPDYTGSTSSQGSLGSQNHTYATAGPETVTVTVTNNNGVQGSATFQVNVAGYPTATVSGPSDGVLYQSRTFTFTASNTPSDNAAGYTYNINWGDGHTQIVSAAANNTTITESHTYTITGPFSVSVTATDQYGNPSAPVSQNITIGLIAVENDLAGQGGIVGLAIAGINGSGGVVLTPGAAADSLTVKRGTTTLGTFTATNGNVVIYGDNSGNDTVTVSATSPPSNGQDTYTLSGNTVNLTGYASPFSFTLNSVGAVTLKGGAYGNSFIDNGASEAATLIGGAGNDSFTFNGTSMGAFTNIQGAGGTNNTLTGPTLPANAVNVWRITGTHAGNLNGLGTCKFTGIENLVGGGNGDTLDYSTYNASTTVNLATPKATAISSFANMTNFIGNSSYSNTLTGANMTNSWSLTGTNSGTVNSDTFSNFGNLTGGTQNDDFVFGSGAGVTGTIKGGSGTNTLDYSGFGAAVYVNLVTGTATNTHAVSGILQVYGSGMGDVLVGNGTNVLLSETMGNNLLIGGTGKATIDSGSGEDIVIAGKTSYDSNASALNAIESYWEDPNNGSEATRVSTLSTTGVGAGPYKLNSSTVTHTTSASGDMLNLGSATDWVFYHLSGTNKDTVNGMPAYTTYI